MNQGVEEAQGAPDLRHPVALAGWWMGLEPPHHNGWHQVDRGTRMKAHPVGGVAGSWAEAWGASFDGVAVCSKVRAERPSLVRWDIYQAPSLFSAPPHPERATGRRLYHGKNHKRWGGSCGEGLSVLEKYSRCFIALGGSSFSPSHNFKLRGLRSNKLCRVLARRPDLTRTTRHMLIFPRLLDTEPRTTGLSI